MEISSVINRDWWFINNWLYEYAENKWIELNNYWNDLEVESYDSFNVPMYEKYINWKLTKEDWKKIWENEEIFKQKAYLYSQEKQAKQNDFQWSQLMEVYSILKQIREKPWYAWFWLEEDFRNKFNFVKNNLTFDKLRDLKNAWATFGALSDGEMKAISEAASMLNYDFRTTSWNWKDRVDHTLKKLEKTFDNLGYIYDVTKLSKEEIDAKYAENKTKNMNKKDLNNAEKTYFNNK